jgi:hypothetical protein
MTDPKTILLVEDEKATRNRISRIMVSGFENFATRHRRKAGSILDVEVSAYCLENEFICFCRELNGIKQARP